LPESSGRRLRSRKVKLKHKMNEAKLGKIYLVGGGCGDPGLLTLRAKAKIETCDALVYDALVNEAFLALAPPVCEKIYVGKRANHHALSQWQINALLVELGQRGKTAVRLKGGDPYVFGRGGEEGIALHRAGVPFEVIPGIPSVIGGLAYAGIPITHRDFASSFQVVTGHLKDGGEALDWPVLARTKGTLVFLMGMKNLAAIAGNLLREGMDPATPAAVVYRASQPSQRVVTATLSTIAEASRRAGMHAPALIVVGRVVALRDELRFFDNKPFFGKTFLVTRSRTQASSTVAKIRELGGEAIVYPTIRIRPVPEAMAQLDEAIDALGHYSHLIFTSVNGVGLFYDQLAARGKDSRALAGLTITAIGKATAAALEARGVVPDVVPKRYIGEALVEQLSPLIGAGDRVLLPRSKNARSLVADALARLCPVTELPIYETIREDRSDIDVAAMLEKREIDVITFTSSTTAKYFAEKLGADQLDLVQNAKTASIGPQTSKQLRALGMAVDIEASAYTIDGLLAAIESDLAPAE
jgi:uroporphyrinogen III methyltransferase/synthase